MLEPSKIEVLLLDVTCVNDGTNPGLLELQG